MSRHTPLIEQHVDNIFSAPLRIFATVALGFLPAVRLVTGGVVSMLLGGCFALVAGLGRVERDVGNLGHGICLEGLVTGAQVWRWEVAIAVVALVWVERLGGARWPSALLGLSHGLSGKGAHAVVELGWVRARKGTAWEGTVGGHAREGTFASVLCGGTRCALGKSAVAFYAVLSASFAWSSAYLNRRWRTRFRIGHLFILVDTWLWTLVLDIAVDGS